MMGAKVLCWCCCFLLQNRIRSCGFCDNMDMIIYIKRVSVCGLDPNIGIMKYQVRDLEDWIEELEIIKGNSTCLVDVYL
jgi:hypothetical protein